MYWNIVYTTSDGAVTQVSQGFANKTAAINRAAASADADGEAQRQAIRTALETTGYYVSKHHTTAGNRISVVRQEEF